MLIRLGARPNTAIRGHVKSQNGFLMYIFTFDYTTNYAALNKVSNEPRNAVSRIRSVCKYLTPPPPPGKTAGPSQTPLLSLSANYLVFLAKLEVEGGREGGNREESDRGGGVSLQF